MRYPGRFQSRGGHGNRRGFVRESLRRRLDVGGQFSDVVSEQSTNGGSADAFVAKLNSTGTALIYATYIGGKGDDRAAGIAVDSTGEAYVTGSTASYNFPLVSPIRSTLGGTRTAFVLRLNSAGNSLLFSTYLGGTAYDLGTAIAVDSSDNAWVVGDTQSANFPLNLPLQSQFAGGNGHLHF